MPPPKPVSNNQKNNQDGQQDEQREQTVVERSSLRTTSGPERTSVVENGQVRSAAGQPFAPEYRMPPLYGEEQSSGQTQQAASLQTHSSKFPVSVIMSKRDDINFINYFFSLGCPSKELWLYKKSYQIFHMIYNINYILSNSFDND